MKTKILNLCVVVVLGLVLASPVGALAQRRTSTGEAVAKSRVVQRELSAKTIVRGYLWNSDQTPVTNATVQLRNAITGDVVARGTTDAVGSFVFTNPTPGTYVIEYVDDVKGGVVAVGHPFTISMGETVATFIRLSGSSVAVLKSMASNVAAAAVLAAVAAGVTVVITPLAPVQIPPPPASPIR